MTLSIDHIVLTVNDIDKTIKFYRDVLGMTLKEFQPADGGETRKSLIFGSQKINLHYADSPYVPHANNPLSGTADICFLSSAPLEEWHLKFTENSIQIEDGPIQKTGATGAIISLYVRDPDKNLIEISNLIET
jgi:catechol 2,3-dioxygenase-like lactoylglutathione lyase family enzyme